MNELYEVWVLDEDGWRTAQPRLDKDTAMSWREPLEDEGFEVRIHPAPIMTADHWVEMGEV